MKLKAQLVENWKDAWKWYSTHAVVLAALINAAQELLPLVTELFVIDPSHVRRATAALAIVAMVGRVIDQTHKNAPAAA